jgi:glutamate/tyrosine decarboxylase-like PLP-dependent enzyme
MSEFEPFGAHSSTSVTEQDLAAAVEELSKRLTDNYPFSHPRYVGQMLKPPHPVAVIGYLAAMLINPNAHALDGGPATAHMEREVMAQLARMFGFDQHLGHLTSSGTIANLEALWVARESHPGQAIAYSADAHYTHSRMCQVLGVEGIAIPVDSHGRMELNALSETLASGKVGTVVATLGTTGLGALDPLREIVRLCTASGVRVHVDAAYGGFFAIIADDTATGVASAPFTAISEADSIVVDPHKHGLQPYGCGAVLFRDPAVGLYYKHDSPYTYFTSDELHLGEISLECSRPGAAAAALWLTLEVLPLDDAGLGSILRACIEGAREWRTLIHNSSEFTLYQEPELDIVTFFPRADRMTRVDELTGLLFANAAKAQQPIHLAMLNVSDSVLTIRHPEVLADTASTRIIRSTVMKPESAAYIGEIHEDLRLLI